MRDWTGQNWAAVVCLLAVVGLAERWVWAEPADEPRCRATVRFTPPGGPTRWVCPERLAERWPRRCGAPPATPPGVAIAVDEVCGVRVVEASAEARLAMAVRLDVNRATWGELLAVPGVGAALAARIVAGRPYASIVGLERVRGIGAKTRARLARWLTAQPPSPLRAVSTPRTPSGSR